MTQINVRVDELTDRFINYLATRRKVSKGTIVKEFLAKGIAAQALPILLDDYQKGRVSVKVISQISGLSPSELLDVIAKQRIDPPIPEEIDDYTSKCAEKLFLQWQKEKK